MKIKATPSWEKELNETIYQYVKRKLDGYEYGSGQLEMIGRTSENNSEAIGRLLDLLSTKGLLTAPEVTKIVEGHEIDDAKFFLT